MKKHLSKMMMILAACLLAVSPVFAGHHDGHDCASHSGKDKKLNKECPPDCDKPCCTDKLGKQCSLHGKKDDCCKSGHAKTNFGPRSRK